MTNQAVVLIYILCYILMFIITGLSKLRGSNRLFGFKGALPNNPSCLVVLHIAGILWFGFVPWCLSKQSLKAILFGNGLPTLSWMMLFIVLLAVIIFTAFRASQKVQIKHAAGSLSAAAFLPFYFPLRIIFLGAYELFFRGVVFFDCIKWVGLVYAIIITTFLTGLIHVFTNTKEMWACIPFGIACCIFCISLHAVWPAIITLASSA